jgi:hypothetical protein
VREFFTYNVLDTLRVFSEKENLDLKELYFKINKFDLFNYKGRIYTPIAHLIGDDKIQESNVRQITGDIAFRYNISILKLTEEYFSKPLKLSVNKAKTVSSVTFLPETTINGKLNKEIFIDNIRRVMIKNRLLPYLFDDELMKNTEKVLDIFHKGPLKKSIKLILSRWPDFEQTIDSKVILHYKLNGENNLGVVKENDKILEVIHPKRGENGHNVFGKIVIAKEPVFSDVSYGENDYVRIDDTEVSRTVYAKKRGYVKIDGSVISIENVLKSSSLSKKSSGDIKADNDYNIEINVESTDSIDDGVGSSMSIESEVISIDGVVGSGAMLSGKDVTVTQSTHKTSKIKAENATIKISRGDVQAKKCAKIDVLENGTVCAENVEINIALGGRVIGKNIKINELQCDMSIEAEESVWFKAIDPNKHFTVIAKRFVCEEENKKDDENEDVLIPLEEQLRSKTFEFKRKSREFKNIDLNIKSNTNNINAIKLRALEEKKSGKPISANYIKAIKNFNAKVSQRDTFIKSLKELKEIIKNLSQEIKDSGSAESELTVSVETKWSMLNKIVYRADDKDETISITPNSPNSICLSDHM